MFEKRKKIRASLKENLRNRNRIFGGWVSYREPAIAETFAMAGFDFVAIDMEHTTISTDQANRIITGCHAEGVACLPRPVSQNIDYIKPLLEAGADGMIIQMVNTPDEVRSLIEIQKFPPLGNRSYGVNRAHGYGLNFDDYISSWNESSSFIIQVESIEAVENIEGLLAYDEVDAVMIGPYDISGSLGVPGQTDHPLVRKASEKVLEACAKHGIGCCTQIADVTDKSVETAFNDGFSFVILSSDLFVLSNWASQMRNMINRFS
jgi:2-keto-3-deoxy-L-rhamnonate aldolase RhmA